MAAARAGTHRAARGVIWGSGAALWLLLAAPLVWAEPDVPRPTGTPAAATARDPQWVTVTAQEREQQENHNFLEKVMYAVVTLVGGVGSWLIVSRQKRQTGSDNNNGRGDGSNDPPSVDFLS